MGLADAVQGGLRPGQSITWTRSDGTAENLTGATLTGTILNRTSGESRAIAGALAVSDATGGVFTWTYDAADVADAGLFDVQFEAAFGSGATPAISFATTWLVKEALS